MEISQLKYYSRGIVTAEKARGENEIMVIPIEFRYISATRVEHIQETDRQVHKVGRGEDVVEVKTSNSIPARWLKFNSNRITPPDVMPDDEVLIWRMGDTDIYYWQDMNIANVKRTEEVTVAFAADPNGKMKDDLSNAYWMSVSTKDKHITLQTSMANGEPFAYTLQINTGDGNAQLTDHVGNVYYIDSANTIVGMENVNGTYFRLDKNVMYGYAPDEMNFHAENTISLKTKTFKIACDTYTCDAKDSYTVNTKSYTVTCKNALIKGDQVKFNAPTTIATALFKCAVLSVGGGGSSSGPAAKVVGSMLMQGSLEVTETLTASKIVTDDLTAAKGNISSFSHGGGKCC